MAINRKRADRAYGLTNPLQNLAPEPITALRAPTVQDMALPGTMWLDQRTGVLEAYTLIRVAANVASWVSLGTSAGLFTSLTTTTFIVAGTTLTATTGFSVLGGPTSIVSDTNAVDAIILDSTLGGIDILASGAAAGEDIDIIATGSSVNITSTENVADAVVISATTGGIDILASGAGAGEDIDIVATGSSVNISATENTPGAITLDATAGGIDILASGAAAGEDIDIESVGSSINLTSDEAVADAITLDASDAAGGIDILTGGGEITLNSGGNIKLTPATNSVAGNSLTLNAKIGAATYTGLTTANGFQETLTVTNSEVSATSSIIFGLADGGTTDSQLIIRRLRAAAGSFSLLYENDGAGTLDGDLILSFTVLN